MPYEAIRSWCRKFGPAYARTLRRRQGRLGDIWHVDELFATIRGERHYIWRAVDQDGAVLDILVTRHRDKKAANRFFRKVLRHQERPPLQPVTDKLRSYPAAHREVFPSVTHRTAQYENNRAEVSHQHTREQERRMRRFKSAAQAQRFSRSPARFRTCSEWRIITSKRSTIDSSGIALSLTGRRRLALADREEPRTIFTAKPPSRP